MLGTIVGDVIGSYWESPKKTDIPFNFPIKPSTLYRFTDDTVCTMAVWDWLLQSGGEDSLSPYMAEWVSRYPNRGYGKRFKHWLENGQQPYESFGNGAAMRCAPIALYATTPEQVKEWAEKSAVISHNHPEAIVYTQVTALVGFYLRQGRQPADILQQLQGEFPSLPLWNKEFSLFGGIFTTQSRPKDLAKNYRFTSRISDTVLSALCCLNYARDFQSGIRSAIALGGDADTLASITGAWLECRYGADSIPPNWLKWVKEKLDAPIIKMLRDMPEYQAIL